MGKLAYLTGKLVHHYSELPFSFLVGFSAYESYQNFHEANLTNAKGIISLVTGVAFTGVALFFTDVILRYCLYHRLKNHQDTQEIRKNKEKYPLEYVERIVITDEKGLEFILEKTRAKEKKEWGTLLRAREEKGTAFIEKIFLPEEIPSGSMKPHRSGIILDDKKIEEFGVQGGHHYHISMPIFESFFSYSNFSIHHGDKQGEKNRIRLLSFNFLGKPELIAYNKQFIYLPTDASKRELVKSTEKDISAYISQ